MPLIGVDDRSTIVAFADVTVIELTVGAKPGGAQLVDASALASWSAFDPSVFGAASVELLDEPHAAESESASSIASVRVVVMAGHDTTTCDTLV
jgi:hypothetical protein